MRYVWRLRSSCLTFLHRSLRMILPLLHLRRCPKRAGRVQFDAFTPRRAGPRRCRWVQMKRAGMQAPGRSWIDGLHFSSGTIWKLSGIYRTTTQVAKGVNMGFTSNVLTDIVEKVFKSYQVCALCGERKLTNECGQCGSHVCFECYRANLDVYDQDKLFKTFVFTCPVCGGETVQKSIGLGSGKL